MDVGSSSVTVLTTLSAVYSSCTENCVLFVERLNSRPAKLHTTESAFGTDIAVHFTCEIEEGNGRIKKKKKKKEGPPLAPFPESTNRHQPCVYVPLFKKPSRVYIDGGGEEREEKMKNKGAMEKKKMENTVSRSSYSYSCTDSFIGTSSNSVEK